MDYYGRKNQVVFKNHFFFNLIYLFISKNKEKFEINIEKKLLNMI